MISLADEIAGVIIRTSFSTVVSAANDFCFEILDSRGDALAHATRSMPVFNLTLPAVCKEILRLFTVRPGDVFITNDPWLCAGHLPDVAVVSPVFVEGRHVGFAAAIAHVSDIGGTLDSYGAREIYDEGLHIPPMRLCVRGEALEPILELIGRNVRMPDQVVGDIRILVSANAACGDAVGRLLREYGLATLDGISEDVQQRSERAMRQQIAALPDGDYPFSFGLDEVGAEREVEMRVAVRGDELSVVYVSAPSAQAKGARNCTLSYTVAHTCYALKSALTPDIPNNQGDFRPLRVTAPAGSILNAGRTASVNLRTQTGWHLGAAVFGALADIAADRVQSAGGLMNYLTVYGQDADGRSFHSYLFLGGGMGATSTGDGESCCIYPSSASNVPIELFEVRVPLLVVRKELLPFSGGAGRFRGGLGQRVTIKRLPTIAYPVTVAVHPHRHVEPAFGLFGAGSGTPSRVFVNDHQVTAEELRTGGGFVVLRDASDSVTVETAGGGGFGTATLHE